ncbi:hypothetical protein BASA62_009820 [Batrachochytrium salamandrivorans]|nr:hypothetical protein BASA62_009820 [Batrachochytrium salamandrivorans]
MESLEEILSSLSARLKLLEDKNETLKVDAQESRATANRAILENTISKALLVQLSNPRPDSQTNSTEQEGISAVLSINSSSSFNFKRVDTIRIGKRLLFSEPF